MPGPSRPVPRSRQPWAEAFRAPFRCGPTIHRLIQLEFVAAYRETFVKPPGILAEVLACLHGEDKLGTFDSFSETLRAASGRRQLGYECHIACDPAECLHAGCVVVSVVDPDQPDGDAWPAFAFRPQEGERIWLEPVREKGSPDA